jgi:hypothetical protein
VDNTEPASTFQKEFILSELTSGSVSDVRLPEFCGFMCYTRKGLMNSHGGKRISEQK